MPNLITAETFAQLYGRENVGYIFYAQRTDPTFPKPAIRGGTNAKSYWSREEANKWISSKRKIEKTLAIRFLCGEFDIQERKKVYGERLERARTTKPKTMMVILKGDL